MKIRIVATFFTALVLGAFESESSAQPYCYRPFCQEGEKCKVYNAYEYGMVSGPCCCNISCSPSGCSCSQTCYKLCSDGATACQNVDCAKGPCGTGAPLYVMSYEEHGKIPSNTPVSIILAAIGAKAAPNTLTFSPGPFSGSRTNHSEEGAPLSGYKFYGNVLVSSPADLVIDIIFEDALLPGIPYSPAPRPVRVTVDSSRNIHDVPLTAEQHAAVRTVFAALKVPQKLPE